ncbi:hypothetical protein MNBD_GAMMA12-3318 [hydrothermal vent metagenome]|uniref:SAM-dependent methyltransferase n=1 Tax=hydrothermal vent metagenome TaxID=652676 RepID=A0A3B0Y0Q7_9ZZZZ
MNRPYAESADQNKEVIVDVLRQYFVKSGNVLEIGAGTGQHARYFSSLLTTLRWTPSEVPDYMLMLEQGITNSGISNLIDPISVDVNTVQPGSSGPLAVQYDYIYSANTLHIMSWQSCINLISLVSNLLASGGLMVTYGPYNVNNQFSSDSNERFDLWLKQRDSLSGIRDIDDLRCEGLEKNLQIDDIIEMPVNNKMLIWRKI